MNSPRLDLVGYFIHENRGLLSLFALGPKILREALLMYAPTFLLQSIVH
jgi:hypothetical protein